MRNLSLAMVGALFLCAPAGAATFGFDAGHTEIRFYWDHVGVSEQSAEWDVVEGKIDFDPNDLAATTVNITIKADSIHTGFEALDTHLKSADFFEVETYPEITFASTAVQQTGKQSIRLTGDLTIKGQSRPISVDVDLLHQGPHPLGQFIEHYQGEWLGVAASGTLLRSEYGVGMFAPLTSDRIRLEISIELKAE
jgi:polyisoprenoid-binding protein YceI